MLGSITNTSIPNNVITPTKIPIKIFFLDKNSSHRISLKLISISFYVNIHYRLPKKYELVYLQNVILIGFMFYDLHT